MDRYAADLLRYIKSCFPHIDVITVGQRAVSSRFSWSLEDLLLTCKVRGMKANVYHAVSPQTAFALLLTRKKPIVTTIHDLIPFRNATTRFYLTSEKPWFAYLRFLTRFAVKSDILLVPFEITRSDLITVLGVEPEKIRVVSPAVDLARFTRNKPRQESSNNRLLYVGSLDYFKGVDILFQIFERVTREFPEAQLRVAGKHGDRLHFQYLARKFGIHHKIRFLGPLTNTQLVHEYQNASVFVWPSRVGFGLQILESIASGTPVVASNTRDIVEILYETVVTVNPFDIDVFAEHICRILVDRRYRENIAEKALRKIHLFSWQAAASKVAEIYGGFAY